MLMSMLNPDLLVIVADSHWSEPPDLFTTLAPAAYQDRLSRVETIDGEQMWVFDGIPR